MLNRIEIWRVGSPWKSEDLIIDIELGIVAGSVRFCTILHKINVSRRVRTTNCSFPYFFQLVVCRKKFWKENMSTIPIYDYVIISKNMNCTNLNQSMPPVLPLRENPVKRKTALRPRRFGPFFRCSASHAFSAAGIASARKYAAS
jgi:hypothetical protein